MLPRPADDVMKFLVRLAVLLQLSRQIPAVMWIVFNRYEVHPPLPPLLHLIYFFWSHLLGHHIKVVILFIYGAG